MTIDYVRLPLFILRIEDLSFLQKIILALVASFIKGLKLGNSKLGKLLSVSASHTSTAINDMERKGYIRIENRQSKYRTIYLAENLKVETIVLHGKPEGKTPLPNGLTGTTSRKTRNITKGTKERRAHKPGKPVRDDGTFERFWTAYPRKDAKKRAQQTWAKIKPTPELVETILAAVERQRMTDQWTKGGGKYIPYASSYLNGERWTDELPEPKRGDPAWLPDEKELDEIYARC